MAALFFASNTTFLVLGTLTLIAQEHIGESWALLDPEGMRPAPLAPAKILLLLFTLLAAFFCFVNGIRLFVHASVSIGSVSSDPAVITAQLDTAWRYQGLGVRCYYFGAPIMFWLFGTLWLALASIAAVGLMQLFDRVPHRGRGPSLAAEGSWRSTAWRCTSLVTRPGRAASRAQKFQLERLARGWVEVVRRPFAANRAVVGH